MNARSRQTGWRNRGKVVEVRAGPIDTWERHGLTEIRSRVSSTRKGPQGGKRVKSARERYKILQRKGLTFEQIVEKAGLLDKPRLSETEERILRTYIIPEGEDRISAKRAAEIIGTSPSYLSQKTSAIDDRLGTVIDALEGRHPIIRSL